MSKHVSEGAVRTAFSDALSAMYREEVPLYGDLLSIVQNVNQQVLNADGGLRAELAMTGEIERLGAERHGAIRVGTAQELSALARVFRVMGMHPVGYYDLSVAGVPVHSTAFRPVDPDALRNCPFRVFTSLLRLELIADEDLRMKASAILAERKILSDRAMELTALAENEGGLQETEAAEFVAEVLETFRWHSTALVDSKTYDRLSAAHRLVADVVSFRGPHINHLTPRTLDIDKAQEEMVRRGMKAKNVIEGPPRRAVPILLRQTSFSALQETIVFVHEDAQEAGAHSARFGEIEQRGVALTCAGRELYDKLLAQARDANGSLDANYPSRLSEAFAAFPDDLRNLREQGLAFFSYELAPRGELACAGGVVSGGDLEDWITEGLVTISPLTYEDFLPVSAAGIFQSNLGGEEQRSYDGNSSQIAFETALGMPILDPFVLYADTEARSRAAVVAAMQNVTNA